MKWDSVWLLEYSISLSEKKRNRWGRKHWQNSIITFCKNDLLASQLLQALWQGARHLKNYIVGYYNFFFNKGIICSWIWAKRFTKLSLEIQIVVTTSQNCILSNLAGVCWHHMTTGWQQLVDVVGPRPLRMQRNISDCSTVLCVACIPEIWSWGDEKKQSGGSVIFIFFILCVCTGFDSAAMCLLWAHS